MRTISAISTTTAVPSSSPAMLQPRSPWHSPVPYLFGGLAAMLGLIAFALLILACSYWRLSGERDTDPETASDKDAADSEKVAKVYEEKILVIMAGHDTPTFLATPSSTRASSFGVPTGQCLQTNDTEKTETAEKSKTLISDNHHQQLSETEEEPEHHQ